MFTCFDDVWIREQPVFNIAVNSRPISIIRRIKMYALPVIFYFLSFIDKMFSQCSAGCTTSRLMNFLALYKRFIIIETALIVDLRHIDWLPTSNYGWCRLHHRLFHVTFKSMRWGPLVGLMSYSHGRLRKAIGRRSSLPLEKSLRKRRIVLNT